MAENSSNTASGSHRREVKRLIIMRHAEADWGLNDVLVTISDPITDTCLSTYLETTIWVVLAEKVCEVDSTIQTEVDGTNNCVTVRET